MLMIRICGGQNCYCLCGQRRTGGGRCDIFPRGHHHHRHHQASDLKCSFFFTSRLRRALLIAQWFYWFFCLRSVVNLTLMWCPEIPLERWDRSSNASVDTCTVYKDGEDCCWSFPSAPSPLICPVWRHKIMIIIFVTAFRFLNRFEVTPL